MIAYINNVAHSQETQYKYKKSLIPNNPNSTTDNIDWKRNPFNKHKVTSHYNSFLKYNFITESRNIYYYYFLYLSISYTLFNDKDTTADDDDDDLHCAL